MFQRLRELRKATGLRQIDMAKKLGICKQYYSQLERGERRLTYDMAVKIARVFGTTPDKIFLPSEYTQSRLAANE